MLIDTHSHIYSEDFNEDKEDVIKRAYQNDIRKIVLPNIDSSSIKQLLDLVEQYPQICFPLMGLHPTSVNEDYRDELELVAYWLKKQKFFGIGEIGIDQYWDKTFLNEQIEAFRYQVKLAVEYQLPIVIHVRDSFDEVFSVLDEFSDVQLTGVFHSFAGTEDQAQKIIDRGFLLGVNGIVTFKNSKLGEVISKIDPVHLLLETDSPYLTPVPFRGKRNESSYVIYVAQKVASLLNISVSELAHITTENAEKLFRI